MHQPHEGNGSDGLCTDHVRGIQMLSVLILPHLKIPSSLHISMSLAYLPAWIVIAVIWHVRLFTQTNVGFLIGIHLILGLSLGSWSFFIATPFGKSPQLAAVVSTIASIVFAILGLIFNGEAGAAFIFSLLFPPAFYVLALRAISGFEMNGLPARVMQRDPNHHIMILPVMIAGIVRILYVANMV